MIPQTDLKNKQVEWEWILSGNAVALGKLECGQDEEQLVRG